MAGQIVGRRGELVALAEFLEASPAGGSASLFEGDAGIGKTALWQEGSRLARERGMRVLTARAAQSELQTSFATVADLFAPVLEETLPRLVPVQRRSLEVAFLIRAPDGPPPEARLIATALLSIVRILVEERPLLFAIDDAQWVDTSSADLLRFVFRRLEGEPVAVLATVRGLPVEAPFELDRAFPSERLRRLRLGPLSVGATHRLLREHLCVSFPRPRLLQIHQTSGVARPQVGDLLGEDLALVLQLEVADDLGGAEHAHGDDDEADAVGELRDVEGEAQHARIDVGADDAEQQPQHHHGDRLDERAVREHGRRDQAEHHEREIFRRPELQRDLGERRRGDGDDQRRDAAGEERADARRWPAPARRGPGAPSGSRRGR